MRNLSDMRNLSVTKIVLNGVFLFVGVMTCSVESKLLGCYQTDTIESIANLISTTLSNSHPECFLSCTKQGYTHAGITPSKLCFCSNFGLPEAKKIPVSACNANCIKYESTKCGIELHQIFEGYQYPEYIKLSSSGKAALLQSNRMKKYKLLPKNINNFPVWKMLGDSQTFMESENYLYVAGDGYWSIGPDPNTLIIGLYSNTKNPTPMTPCFTSGWKYWDKNQKKREEFQKDDGIYVEPIEDTVCIHDFDIGDSSENIEDIGKTHTAISCSKECSKKKMCMFFVWSGPESRRCWLRKIKDKQFDQIPQKPLTGAVAGLRHCSIRTITSIVTGCTDRGVEKWNTKRVSSKLTSWIKSLITVGDKGSIQSKLYDRKAQSFLTHFSGYNDHYYEPTAEEKKDEKQKLHVTLVTIGEFGDQDSEKWNQLVSGKPVWQYKSRRAIDGFLYGSVDFEGMFTGDNITFLYPDMITGLRGKFVNGEMIKAREVRVVAERCANGIKQLKMKLRNKRKHIIWEREETTVTYIGKYPKEADPYERRTSFINDSTINKSIDGVFAKRKLMPGELVAYFSGVKTYNKYMWSSNMTDSQKEAAFAYVYAFGKYNKGYQNALKIDVGVDLRGRTDYRTTIGHKVNHKFLEDNTHFGNVIHPSFGDIVSIVAKKVIDKGEELFTNYNYNYSSERAPTWWAEEYFKAYATPLKSLNNEK